MKKFFYILVLSAIFNIGCRQTETVTNGLTTNNTETKAAAVAVSGTAPDAAEPAITADSDGNIYVVYVEHGADKTADIYLQKFDLQKQPNGEKVRVNREAGEATAWRGDSPTIAVGADKTVYVGWTKTVKTDAASGRDVCLSVSHDNGKTFAAPVKVNDDIKPASHGMHSLAIGANNAVYLAWLDERNVKSDRRAENFESNSSSDEFQFVKIHHNSNEAAEPKKEEKHEAAEPNSEIFFAASNDGGKTFSANIKLSSEVCPCCKTSLAAASDGRIYAGWRQVLDGGFRHIAVASSNNAGKTFTVPTIVSDDRWKINACPVSGAALSVGGSNALKVAWFTAGDAGKIGLYETESNDFGATFAERRLISEGEISGTPNFFATIAANSKILWEADGKIYQSQAAGNREFGQAELLSAGTLPSAVGLNGKTFAVFIKKETDKRSVWLAEF